MRITDEVMDKDEIILAEGGSPKKRLRISLQQFEKQPLLNIRYYYEDALGEIRPTRKGVSITRNRYLDLVEAIEKHNEAILGYLQNGVVGQEFLSWDYVATQAHLRSGPISAIHVNTSPLRGRDVSQVTYGGGEVSIKLNINDPFVKKFEGDVQKLAPFARVLVAFDLAAKLTCDSESLEVQHAIERLRLELSRQLRNLPQE